MTRDGSEFGRWLDLTLKDKGISGRDLAAEIGVSESLFSKWRTGMRRPSPRDVSKLAQVLEVDQFRLIVTAGLLEPDEHHKSLPIPTEEPIRRALREQLASIPGFTKEDVQAQLDAYDRRQRRKNGNGNGNGS